MKENGAASYARSLWLLRTSLRIVGCQPPRSRRASSGWDGLQAWVFCVVKVRGLCSEAQSTFGKGE
eukprot:scaffold113906_cov63-Phaeocystis_antarctica.AAC.2